MQLEGKRALVTGGSGDIGSAIARALAAAGARVAISYAGFVEGARRTVAALDAAKATGAFAIQLDQRDPDGIERARDETLERHGGLDILVNNAAWNIGIPFPDLETLDPETWNRVLETNLLGPYLLARAFAPGLAAGGGGHIVNIASTAGLAPGGSSIAYACSKAGFIHLTRCLAVALAPSVQVNCIAPGLVEGTRMAARLPGEAARRARDQAVLGRVGDAEDIARQTVAFCTTGSVTGQVIAVDGGMPGAMR